MCSSILAFPDLQNIKRKRFSLSLSLRGSSLSRSVCVPPRNSVMDDRCTAFVFERN